MCCGAGNFGAAVGALGILSRLVPKLRAAFPRARLRVRLDGGFAAPQIFAFLEREGLAYVVAMAKNKVLERRAARGMGTARLLSRESGETAHVYDECRYAAGTWEQRRRVVTLQGLARSVLRREVRGHRGAVSGPARAGVSGILSLHLIADNYSTLKHPKVKRWLARHPRFHMHFVPTSSSWLNLVERFFRDLSEDSLREGSFQSVRELTRQIESYLAERNLDPKPYRWRARGEEILAKIQRARATLAQQASTAQTFMRRYTSARTSSSG
jgi:hypothetical protein